MMAATSAAPSPPLSTDTVADKDIRCFTVSVAGRTYGLPVDAVQTIFRIDVATTIPLGPYEILGLVNLRGKIVTAVSLRRRLGLPDAEGIEGALAVGLDYKSESFALVVDDVGDVITLDPTTEILLPPNVADEQARLTSTAHRLPDRILPILDLSAVFDFGRKSAATIDAAIGKGRP